MEHSKLECSSCGEEFNRSEDSDYGGEETCPHCGAVHDLSFDTQIGLYVDGVTEPEIKMEHTKGKWIYKSVGERMSGGISQTTTFSILSEDDQGFYSKPIAKIEPKWPNDDFIERDGSPDTLAISINNLCLPLAEAEANAAFIVQTCNEHASLKAKEALLNEAIKRLEQASKCLSLATNSARHFLMKQYQTDCICDPEAGNFICEGCLMQIEYTAVNDFLIKAKALTK